VAARCRAPCSGRAQAARRNGDARPGNIGSPDFEWIDVTLAPRLALDARDRVNRQRRRPPDEVAPVGGPAALDQAEPLPHPRGFCVIAVFLFASRYEQPVRHPLRARQNAGEKNGRTNADLAEANQEATARQLGEMAAAWL
jgi:hypothetical protein